MSNDQDTKSSRFAGLVCELVQAAEARSREETSRRLVSLLEQAVDEGIRNRQGAPVAAAVPMQFAGEEQCLYLLNPDATATQVGIHLSGRLTQLRAMLAATYGNHMDAFSEMNPSTRDDYMWNCHTLAQECEDLVDHLNTLQRRERESQS